MSSAKRRKTSPSESEEAMLSAQPRVQSPSGGNADSPKSTPNKDQLTPIKPIRPDGSVKDGDSKGLVSPNILTDEDAMLAEPPSNQPGSSTTSPRQPYRGGPNATYNALKSFNGQVYSGMAVGGSHTWNYDPGVWKEEKKEPDLWQIDYETTKRRAKNAPQGSGAPVGTEYHWLIVAHQYVTKVDANTYETRLSGSKYKLAHKGSNANSWSVSTVKAQREREMDLLDDAKRRVQGLPPVLASEKARSDPFLKKKEKGQQRLEAMFSRTPEKGSGNRKRKLEDKENEIDV